METYVRRYGLEHLLGELSDVADKGRAKREIDFVLGAVPHVQPMHSILVPTFCAYTEICDVLAGCGMQMIWSEVHQTVS